jgi:hypothetical protein
MAPPALSKVAHDTRVKLFQWRGRTSKKEFRKRFIELMREAAPQIKVVESPDDDLDALQDIAEGKTATVSLHRGYEEFAETPAERDQILGRWVAMQLSIANPEAPARDNIVPMIKDRGYLRRYYAQYNEPIEPGSARDLAYDEINEEFLVLHAKHSGGSFLYLNLGDMKNAGVSRDELRAVALSNLRTRTPTRGVSETGGVRMISVGGNFESAMLIDGEIWRHRSLVDLDPLIVAAPERSKLIAALSDSASDVFHLAYMSMALLKTEPYPISPRLMTRRNEKFELLDPTDVDDSHPIPRLDVLDVSVTSKRNSDSFESVAIVIASPLGADPRSIYRFFCKLESYLNHLGCEFTGKDKEVPNDSRPRIYIHIHGASHPDVLDLVNSLGPYVKARGARLEVTIK